MNFLHWLFSIFHRNRKGYRLELPIGLQKKNKRTALFGESLHSKKGG